MAFPEAINIKGRSTIRSPYLKELTFLIGKIPCKYLLNRHRAMGDCEQ